MSQTLAQRRTALVRANEVRLAMSDVKRELADGRLELADAVNDPRAQRMRVAALLRAVRHIGPKKADQICHSLLIGPGRHVGDLSDRQRLLVAKAGTMPVTRSSQMRLSMAVNGDELVIA